MKKIINQFTDNYTPEEIFMKLMEQDEHPGWNGLRILIKLTNSLEIFKNRETDFYKLRVTYRGLEYETDEYPLLLNSICDALSNVVEKGIDDKHLFPMSDEVNND